MEGSTEWSAIIADKAIIPLEFVPAKKVNLESERGGGSGSVERESVRFFGFGSKVKRHFTERFRADLLMRWSPMLIVLHLAFSGDKQAIRHRQDCSVSVKKRRHLEQYSIRLPTLLQPPHAFRSEALSAR